MPERVLSLTLTNGSLTEVRAWLTPVPGLLVAERPMGGWVIACESARTRIGLFGDPEAALACAIEIGPLARWEIAGEGRLALPSAVIAEIGRIVRRRGGGEIDVKGSTSA